MEMVQCPRCSSGATVPILYGLPGLEAAGAEQRGELVLGGCVVFGDDETRACLECGQRFTPVETEDAGVALDPSTGWWGRFPFGQPNSQRPMRLPAAGSPAALVVGAYPSAFHVSWWPPAALELRSEASRGYPFIGSLAVDVEPVVFWDGASPSAASELERWKVAVSYDEAVHGRMGVGNNGPSGIGLEEDTLKPLGLDPSTLAFTDALPWYFVKKGKGSQGEAVATRLMPIAEDLGIDPGSLPLRPAPRKLVEIASHGPRRASLREEIVLASAPLVITLGQEALDTVLQVSDEPVPVRVRLSWKDYGQVRHLMVDGRQFDLLPLVHPSFRRQTLDPRWTAAFSLFSA